MTKLFKISRKYKRKRIIKTIFRIKKIGSYRQNANTCNRGILRICYSGSGIDKIIGKTEHSRIRCTHRWTIDLLLRWYCRDVGYGLVSTVYPHA